MADKSIPLKLVELNAIYPKSFDLRIPIGDKVYTPTTAQAICGPANIPYKIPFDVDDPSTAESTDELIGITSLYSQRIPLAYSFDDLNYNYIELSASPDGQIGTSETNSSFECRGLSGILSIRLCSFPNPEAPAETVFNSRVSQIQSTAYVNKFLWDSYRYGPHWDPSNPWGDGNWITPNRDWFNNNAYTNIGLIVWNGIRPRISFHLEKFRDPRWEERRFIECLVINHWFWDRNPDTSEGAPPYIYRIRNQQIIAAKYISDDPFIPQVLLTPSKTKNSTPEGGTGARDNTSQNVPMPAAADLRGLNYFADVGDSGIHLYQLSVINWKNLQKKFYNASLIKRFNQSGDYGTWGLPNFAALTNLILSAAKIGLPLTEESTPGVAAYVHLGSYTFNIPNDGVVQGKALQSQFAETEEYVFKIPFYSKTYLDFSPYTRIQIHVPYCGVADISPDSCMGGEIRIKYIVDLVTSGCTAVIQTRDQFNNRRISTVLSGICGISVPLLSNQINQEKIVGSIGAIATSLATGNPIGAIGGAANLLETNNDQINSTKVKDYSSVSGMSAIMGDRSLYVSIFHPQDITSLDIDGTKQIDNFGNKIGYPAAFTAKINDIDLSSGTTECYIEAIVNPNSIQTATDAEKEAIRALIQKGVYI